jgi:Leucine-rich repeat (LRR) protein
LSHKNIKNFKDNVKAPYFSKLENLYFLNLSHNLIKKCDEIKSLHSIRTLNISFNKISELSFLDNLINLEILYASDNEISSITSMVGLGNLRILEIQRNKISYNLSTMKTLSNLKSLRELYIVDNPVLPILI